MFRTVFNNARNLLRLGRCLRKYPHIDDLLNRLIDVEKERDSNRRYNRRFELLNGLADSWGFEIYNRHGAWQSDIGFWELWKEFPLAGQRPDRKFVLWSIANSVRKLSGDTAECGVFLGHSTHLICSVLGDRLHHVFDSFEGLSAPQPEDSAETQTAYEWQQGDLSVSLDTVQKNLSRAKNITYHKGWIPSRFADVGDRRFALVHVDVDLFQPTLDSLEFFCERMVRGGIIVCDDYGYETCPGARRAFDMVSEKTGDPVIHLPTGQGIMIRS